MTTYIVRRLLQSLVFIGLAALAIYTLLVMLMPSGPYQSYTDRSPMPTGVFSIQPISRDELQQTYKLDKPWPLNFVFWLFDPSDTVEVTPDQQEVPRGIDIKLGGLRIKGSGILTGDWGRSVSVAHNVYVAKLIGDRWVNTLALVGLALAISVALALPLGILAAVRRHSVFDHTFTFFSFAGLSVPPFVLGLVLVIIFAVLPRIINFSLGLSWLPNLPGGGVYSGTTDTIANRLWHLVLPVATLAIPEIAWLSRYIRFSMLDVLGQDYIRTAWAKGLSQRRVIVKHAFRNALIPVITVVGLALPTLASGSIVVESVFGYTGMGQLYYRAIGGCLATQSMLATDRPPCNPMGYPPDYPLALIMTMLLLSIVALSNVLADVLYATADPRISYNAKAHS